MLHSRPNGVAGSRASADLSLSLYIHCSEESDIPSMLAIYITSFSQLDVEDYHGENALNLTKNSSIRSSPVTCATQSHVLILSKDSQFQLAYGLDIYHGCAYYSETSPLGSRSTHQRR